MVASQPTWTAAVAVVFLIPLAVGVGRSARDSRSVTRAGSQSSVPPSTAAPAATTTVPPATTTTRPHPPGLIAGDSGPAVQALQTRLLALHYDVGTPDGQYGGQTSDAVLAFQKVHGMDRTGNATPDVIAAAATASDPAPLVPSGGADRVEVDIPHQVLYLYQGGSLSRILPVSTGSGHHYCENGDCGDAITPGGSFRVFEKIQGLHISPLGQLWNPLFFNGGIAIHGEPSVPAYPASHGCVRIPMSATVWFFNQVGIGEPVYVIGGPKAPPPLPALPPNDPAVSSPPTTAKPVATTAPPATTTPTSAPAPTTTAPVPAPTTTTTKPAG